MVCPRSFPQPLSGWYRSTGWGRWNRWRQSWAVFHISKSMPSFLQGFIGWFLGTFIFYWWHRARHDFKFLWRVCHQVHHSPARIELLTAFYKHPIEIAADSLIASAIMFSLLGASPTAGAWFNVFAVLGEYFYHSNLRTPPLGRIRTAKARASFRPSPIGCPRIQLWRHHLVGSLVWYFSRTDAFAPDVGFPTAMRISSGMLVFRDEY